MKRDRVNDEQAIQLLDAGVVCEGYSIVPCTISHPTVGDLIKWLESKGNIFWINHLYNINYHPEDNELIDELVHLCMEWTKE